MPRGTMHSGHKGSHKTPLECPGEHWAAYSVAPLAGWHKDPADPLPSCHTVLREEAVPTIADMNAGRRVFVVGVGMTKKPGRLEGFTYPVMVKEAVGKALKDASLSYNKIEQAAVGYVYGDSTCGQRALYEVGMTGIPIYNVNNNCSTGSTALFMAYNLIKGGVAKCVLALGFEKMERGSLSSKYHDRENPIEKHVMALTEVAELEAAPMAPQLFGNAGVEHMKKYGSTPLHMAKIAHKNHKHSTNNPYSQFQEEYTLEQIVNSPKVAGPLTKLQCCPTSDGAGAAVVASEEFVVAHGLQDRAVEIVAMDMTTDFESTFNDQSAMKIVGYDMTKVAAERVFKAAGLTPADVDVVELHDCFSANELITYEALGLCGEGEAGHFIDSGSNTYGGKVVVNPSGGLISKGHPLGATGLAQCSELCWQLRGAAGRRQVPGAQVALQHNLGLGGAAVVTLYRMGFKGNGGRIVAAAAAAEDFKSAAIFAGIENALKEDGAALVSKVCKPDVTITMSDGDLVDLMEGKLNAQKAFFQGKLKIKGNMGLAMKLQEFQKQAGQLKAKL
ncbi:Non-specific lipid-transfer protein [Chionoecetes opilio]|uniref:Sterol carrier protein 2 n=1 Tax=Chionoecetes opilio TaxID=41210 RepID=A0A8J4YSD1_CHIOP|nr:Non-specific lipid-transfer protein [Chionoecetes opilio]